MYNIVRFKHKKLSMPKIGYIDLSPVKNSREEIPKNSMGKNDKLDMIMEDFHHHAKQLEEEHINTQEDAETNE